MSKYSWRDIESVPRDGTIVLLACTTWAHSTILGKPVPIKVGAWDVENGRWWILGASWTPTHWMVIPDPPETGYFAD